MATNRVSTRQAATNSELSWDKLDFTARPKESLAERKHRLEMARWKTMIELTRHSILYIAALILAGLVGWVCISIVLDASASPDDRKWATAILTSITTALVGFLVGQGLPGGIK